MMNSRSDTHIAFGDGVKLYIYMFPSADAHISNLGLLQAVALVDWHRHSRLTVPHTLTAIH